MAEPKVKKKKSILLEFKEFVTRGNVIDLAVGVIIGAAFQKIVTSLVSDIIMPLIGRIFGTTDFSNLFIILSKVPASADSAKLNSLSYVKDQLGLAVFAYGSFITAVINFIILAAIIFLMVKFINNVRTINLLKSSKLADEPEPTTKVCPYCLTEINRKAARCPHCTSNLNEAEKTI